MHSQSWIKAACLLASLYTAQAENLSITNVNVIDTATGKVAEGQDITVQGNKITSISNGGGKQKRQNGGKTIDGTGMFAIPGLCDMHTHAYFTNDAQRFPATDNIIFPLYIANGVTCIRDLGSNLGAIKSGRDRIAAHQLEGPRIFFTGPMLDGPDSGFQTIFNLTDPKQVPGVIKQLKDAGASSVKTHLRMSEQVFDAIATESKKAGLPFGGHVPDDTNAQHAVDMGMTYIEHMSRLDGQELSQKLISQMSQQQTQQCPTLKLSPFAERLEQTKTLFDAKIPFVAGTDSPAGGNLCPGRTMLDELVLINKAGLSTAQTLQTATVNAAQVLGQKTMGTLAQGNVADMVLLSANPLQDMNNIRKIEAVVADGQLFDKQKIDGFQQLQAKLSQCDEPPSADVGPDRRKGQGQQQSGGQKSGKKARGNNRNRAAGAKRNGGNNKSRNRREEIPVFHCCTLH
ncbi:hypothetical protein CDD82_5086 [Ophiocordyceps australis]|uniref:Amidohydrolase-related domain-containing protein n=1 Tax=Ophiocordyceps australis TaxID=1399860 RepID=A0A2C5Z2X0_9HYPO|nr:hypothetical protein CDD82_5086 [Ophiocordyceps australis]